MIEIQVEVLEKEGEKVDEEEEATKRRSKTSNTT